RRSRLSSAVMISSYWNEPQRLLNEPAGTVGCAPVRSPALLAGFASGAVLVSWLASGLLCAFASCGCALGAAARIAPALAVGAALVVPARAGPLLLGVAAFGVVAAVCVDFAGGPFFFWAGAVAVSGAGSDPFNPTNRDMRSITPSEELVCSGLFDENRPPNQ